MVLSYEFAAAQSGLRLDLLFDMLSQSRTRSGAARSEPYLFFFGTESVAHTDCKQKGTNLSFKCVVPQQAKHRDMKVGPVGRAETLVQRTILPFVLAV